MPSSEKTPPRKVLVPVKPLMVTPEVATWLKRALISTSVAPTEAACWEMTWL